MPLAPFRRQLHAASPVEKADVATGLALARFRDRGAVKAASRVGELSDQEPLYVLTGIAFAAGLLLRDRRLAEAGGRMLAAVVLSAALKSAVKRRVTRSRPHVLMDQDRYETGLGGDDQKPMQSFPSGHAAGAVAAARALTRIYPDAGWAAFLTAAALGLTRVARGAHYPLDVVGGAAVGLAAEAATHAGVRAGRRLAPALPERFASIARRG